MNNIDRIFSKDPNKFADSYLNYLQSILKKIDTKEIASFIETLLNAGKRKATVFFIGNGGSTPTASRFANDISIGSNDYEEPFKALSLTDNLFHSHCNR